MVVVLEEDLIEEEVEIEESESLMKSEPHLWIMVLQWKRLVEEYSLM